MNKKISFKKLMAAILPGIGVAFAGCFLLFCYAPFELYITNHKEFWFSSGQMMPAVLALFFAGFAALAVLLAVARIIDKKLYTAVVAIGFAAVLGFYVQGNFLVKNLPGLDGAVIDWGAYPAERLKSVLLWVGVLLLAAVLVKLLGAKRFANVAGLVSLGLSLMLGVTLGTLFLSVDESEKSNVLVSTDKNLFTLSEDKNLVVLVFDAVDGCEFERIVYENDEYMEVFRDFIYYDNAMGGYPYSICSEPLLLTGQWHEAKTDFETYVSEAVQASPFLGYLGDNGYTTGLYSITYPVLWGIPDGYFDNMTADRPVVGSQLFMAKLVVKMAVIKYAPWDLKFFGYDLFGRLNEHKVYGGEEGLNYFDWTNLSFYNQLRDENPIAVEEGKYVKFLHLEGSHVPHQYDKYMNVSADATYQSSIEASVYLLSVYIERLKEAGVYDDTVLVVMSDHGYARAEDPNLSTLQQHPVVLIKGLGESREEMEISNAPISFEDLQLGFERLLEGKASDEVFDWKEGDYRERRFLVYEWTNQNHFEEYVQTGQAEDMDTLVPTGRVFDYVG